MSGSGRRLLGEDSVLLVLDVVDEDAVEETESWRW